MSRVENNILYNSEETFVYCIKVSGVEVGYIANGILTINR